MEFQQRFEPFRERMEAAGLPQAAIRAFRHYYGQLVAGETGLVREQDIEPIRSLPDAETIADEYRETGRKALKETVIIKLNGGLGTSMGMQKAKSLLKVKDGLHFLDIIARQSLHSGVPLLLMNSFATREDSLAALEAYPDLRHPGLPLDFLQNKFPKVRQSDLAPAESPGRPNLKWNPPGHGDLYTALQTSDTLQALLDAGRIYAFVSNGDNLGAVLDEKILGYFASKGWPFMMEAADRTPADRKGGHLARRIDGGLLLRESAQCAPEDEDTFQDIRRHAYFNTNNIWIHLPSLKELMDGKDQVMGLPLIRNAKHLDPRDPDSEPVYQLESAMGAAIGVFENGQALRVPRSRFSPVKTTADLLVVRSDAYELTEDFRVVPGVKPVPDVTLDPRYYKLIDDLQARFPEGPPSLRECTRLNVQGNVYFGKGVTITGRVEITNSESGPRHIEDGATIQGL